MNGEGMYVDSVEKVAKLYGETASMVHTPHYRRNQPSAPRLEYAGLGITTSNVSRQAPGSTHRTVTAPLNCQQLPGSATG